MSLRNDIRQLERDVQRLRSDVLSELYKGNEYFVVDIKGDPVIVNKDESYSTGMDWVSKTVREQDTVKIPTDEAFKLLLEWFGLELIVERTAEPTDTYRIREKVTAQPEQNDSVSGTQK